MALMLVMVTFNHVKHNILDIMFFTNPKNEEEYQTAQLMMSLNWYAASHQEYHSRAPFFLESTELSDQQPDDFLSSWQLSTELSELCVLLECGTSHFKH